MKVSEFMEALTDCYDFEKTPGQFGLITNFLQTIPETRLDKLWIEITEKMSTEYSSSLDLARVKKMYLGMVDDRLFQKQNLERPALTMDREEFNTNQLDELHKAMDKNCKKINITTKYSKE